MIYENPYSSPSTHDADGAEVALPAPFPRIVLRAVARGIDTTLLTLPWVALHMYAIPAVGSVVFGILVVASSVVAAPMYFALCHHHWGYTLGKRLLGLKVVDRVSSARLNLVRSFAREVLWNVTIPLYLWIQYQVWATLIKTQSPVSDYNQIHDALGAQSPYVLLTQLSSLFSYGYPLLCLVLVFFDLHGRAPHDFMADSVVVKSKRGPSAINGA